MTGHITTKWSKIKRDVESRFAASVAGRVALFMTGCRTHHNETGRWAMKIDGCEAVSVGDIQAWSASPWEPDDTRTWAQKRAAARSNGLHDRNDVLNALHQYLSLDVRSAQESDDPLIQALAVLDRRTGKRRLQGMFAQSEALHPLVRRCLIFRCEVEGISVKTPLKQDIETAEQPGPR